MTFTEAAAQVLRLVGKPLHYKEITDVAIEKNLLSHVGKSPEVTMGARLAALVKKEDKENPLVRVKPGVFALREWDQETIDKGLKDRTPALERIAAEDSEPEAARAAHVSLAEFADDGEPMAPDAEERERAELAAQATELFDAEADDDQPIFGAEGEEVEAGGEARAGQEGAGRRRRRRRRRRGDERLPGGDDLPAYTVSDAPADLPVVADAEGSDESAAPGDAGRSEDRPRREHGERSAEGGRREHGERSEGGRREHAERSAESGRREHGEDRARADDRGRDDRSRDDRGRDDRPRDDRSRDGRDDRGRRDARPLDGDRDRGRAPIGDAVGKSLADSLEGLLGGFDRTRGPVGLPTLVDAAERRGRLNGEGGNGQALLLSAARIDNARRAVEGKRPRFRIAGAKIGLTDWQMDAELARAERDLYGAFDRYREASRRSFLRSLQELPHRALGELCVLLLERLGYVDLAPVRRQGSHGAELHLAGRSRGPEGELRRAVVIRRDGREIGRERVTELRGGLHHYGPAQAGTLITTGQVLSGAREEAAAPGAAPVTLIDGLSLARLCEEQSVGVCSVVLRPALPDLDFLDGLRSG